MFTHSLIIILPVERLYLLVFANGAEIQFNPVEDGLANFA